MDLDALPGGSGADDAHGEGSGAALAGAEAEELESVLKSRFFDLEPDEDLDVSEAHNQVWLVKVPKFLHQGWGMIGKEGLHLGTVRVYDAPPGGGNPKMELLLPSAPSLPIPLTPAQLASVPEAPHVPRAYDLRLTDQTVNGYAASGSRTGRPAKPEPRNLYAFREKRPREDVEEELAYKRQRRLARGLRADDEDHDEDDEDEDDLDDDEDLIVDGDDAHGYGGRDKGKGKATASDWSRAGAANGGESGDKAKRNSKFRRHTALVGAVSNEAAISPQLFSRDGARTGLEDKKKPLVQLASSSRSGIAVPPSRLATGASNSEYSRLMKMRTTKSAQPKHTVVLLDEADEGLTNRISSGITSANPAFYTGRKPAQGRSGGDKFARMPRNELLDRLFTIFEKSRYHQFSSLRQETQQPETYLREVLQSIATMERRGAYTGYWGLRPEYLGNASESKRNEEREAQRKKEEAQRQAESRKAQEGDDGDDDEDDDDDDEE